MILALFLLPTPLAPTPSQSCVPDPSCIGTNTGTFYGVHTLCVPATNHVEKYLIEGPEPNGVPNGIPKPLIVFFHQFAGDHLTASQNSLLWARATDATGEGFLVVSHDGGWDANCAAMGHKTYGSEEFHAATRAVLADVLANFPNDVNRNRVYGYGFSLGGGNVLNYAARHQDPTATNDVMFAAVVNHSGSVSVPFSYFHDYTAPLYCTVWGTCTGTAYQSFFNTQYGSDYCSNDFVFQRATVLDWTDFGQPVKQATSMAVNLHPVPIQTHYDTNDCLLSEPDEELDSVLSSNHVLVPLGTTHAWNDINEAAVLSFFSATQTLENTTDNARSGYTLIAEDGARYFFFKGQRTSANDFGRLLWGFPLHAPNRLNLNHVAADNLRKVTVIADDWTERINLANCLRIYHADPFFLTVSGYTAMPQNVTLDGGSVSWSFASGEVNILVTTPGLVQITPAGGTCP